MTQTIAKIMTARFNCENAAKFGYAAYWGDNNRDFLIGKFMEEFREAAEALGYRLVPLTQDKPDSGRPSIPETEPAQKENCNG